MPSFASLNSLYTSVSSRASEIAAFRALGFGGAIACFGFNGFTAATLNQASFSQIAFDFAVTGGQLPLGRI